MSRSSSERRMEEGRERSKIMRGAMRHVVSGMCSFAVRAVTRVS